MVGFSLSEVGLDRVAAGDVERIGALDRNDETMLGVDRLGGQQVDLEVALAYDVSKHVVSNRIARSASNEIDVRDAGARGPVQPGVDRFDEFVLVLDELA